MSPVISVLPVPGRRGLQNPPVPPLLSPFWGWALSRHPQTATWSPHKYLKMENKNLYRWDNLEEEQRGNGSALPLGLWALRPRTCRLSLASSWAILSRKGAIQKCTPKWWGQCLEFSWWEQGWRFLEGTCTDKLDVKILKCFLSSWKVVSAV